MATKLVMTPWCFIYMVQTLSFSSDTLNLFFAPTSFVQEQKP